MKHRPRVFIDTSELFPFTIMDVLLTMCEDFLFTWSWTEEVLDEWEDVIVREGFRTPESARSVTNAVREHFGRYRIDPSLYRNKVTENLSPDPGDRVHVAACILGSVDVILTRNRADFSSEALSSTGIQVMHADAFLISLLEAHPESAIESFTRAAAEKRNPAMTPRALAERIEKAGAREFGASMLRRFQ